MGEVDVGLLVDAGEVVERVVVVAGEAVAGAAAVGVDEGGDGGGFADGGEITINAEMLQHEAQRAHGRMIGGKLMMVEVVALRGVLTADIDDGDGGIGEILWGGFAADDGHAMYGGEEAAGEEFVFVGAAGMGEDEGQRHGGLERSAGGLEVKG